MGHEIHRVTAVEQVAAFILRLAFADGTSQTIDFSPILAGEIYGPLADPTFFRQVRLDPESHTIFWPNVADFDPAQLHDWPLVRDDFARLAQTWAAAHV
jgi:Protein of unknown function (DUF2442)